jgi:hypothetical protein
LGGRHADLKKINVDIKTDTKKFSSKFLISLLLCYGRLCYSFLLSLNHSSLSHQSGLSFILSYGNSNTRIRGCRPDSGGTFYIMQCEFIARLRQVSGHGCPHYANTDKSNVWFAHGVVPFAIVQLMEYAGRRLKVKSGDRL